MEAGGEGEGEDDGGFEDLETGQVYGRMSGDDGGGSDDDDLDDDDDGGDDPAAAAAEALRRRSWRRGRGSTRRARGRRRRGGRRQLGGRPGRGGRRRRRRRRDGGGGGGGASALKPGQELFEEDPFIVETRKAQNAQRQRNADFGKEVGRQEEARRAALQGYAPGTYVRVLLERVPCELVRHFEPRFPLIVGGLQPGEETLGVTLCRLKKHRWHKRVLKSSDALVFSVGWRRFQSLPLYCTKDANLRLRHIKYTPEHMHCLAAYYAT